MTPYHGKVLLSEGCRVQHSAKMATMGSTQCTSHCRHFLLGAAIDPLSQQKTVAVVSNLLNTIAGVTNGVAIATGAVGSLLP